MNCDGERSWFLFSHFFFLNIFTGGQFEWVGPYRKVLSLFNEQITKCRLFDLHFLCWKIENRVIMTFVRRFSDFNQTIEVFGEMRFIDWNTQIWEIFSFLFYAIEQMKWRWDDRYKFGNSIECLAHAEHRLICLLYCSFSQFILLFSTFVVGKSFSLKGNAKLLRTFFILKQEIKCALWRSFPLYFRFVRSTNIGRENNIRKKCNNQIHINKKWH